MKPVRLLTMSLITSSALFLAACESDTEKAERYFQSGLALVEQGDKERALLELRNVFQHDGFHREARETYAQLLQELDRGSEAYSQYLRLIEQYPDAVNARVELAEMAIKANNWEEVERHATAAIELKPERLDTQVLGLLLKYREARIAKDTQAAADIAMQASKLVPLIRAEGAEDNGALIGMVLDNMLISATTEETLAFLETALERDPGSKDLNLLKARMLDQNGDVEGTGAQLKTMVDLFPEDDAIKQAIISWYLRQNDVDGAESFLRTQAGPDTGPTEAHVAVIQLLGSHNGKNAALAEIKRLEDANAGTDNEYFYATMRLSIDYQQDTAAAITELETLISKTGDDEQKGKMQVLLAQMLVQTKQPEKVAALVATILETDPSNIPALKMQAAQLIADDQPGEAIIALRRALNQNPRDSETLTIMAQAHQRDGDIELAGERLALAVEASGSGIGESIQYARFLISEGRQQVAETMLEDARTKNPHSPRILGMLAKLYIQTGEWEQAQDIVNALRTLKTPDTDRAATELQAAILQGQDRLEDSLGVLENQLASSADLSDAARTRALMLVIQTQIRGGKVNAARTSLNAALVEDPENPDLRMLSATLYALSGDFQTSNNGYQELITQFPQSASPVRMLINLLIGQGNRDEATAVLQAGLKRMPEDPTLLSLNAGLQERSGDVEAAIATYEKLYEQDSSSMLFANNLASLLSVYRQDPESLTRAATIARRLRGTDLAPFQDTYGWISYRRGNLDEALEYLVPAAAALMTDPLVQYHLGMTYAGLGNTEAAKTQLELALTIGEGRDLPQLQIARDTLATLSQDAAPAEN